MARGKAADEKGEEDPCVPFQREAQRAGDRSCGGRVEAVVTEPLPSQTRACAIDALGSSHGRFAQTADVSGLLSRASGRGNR